MKLEREPRLNLAIQKIWLSYDIEQMEEGRQMLENLIGEDIADAYAYLARCSMGGQYVWDGCGWEEDDGKAKSYLKKAIELGSADAIFFAIRSGLFTPSVKKLMKFPDVETALCQVMRRAQDLNDPFSCYIVANVLFYGDYVIIRGDKDRGKWKDIEDYCRSFGYPTAARFYEDSFEKGLDMGLGNYRTMFESGLSDLDEDDVEWALQTLADFGAPCPCIDYGRFMDNKYEDQEELALKYYKKAFEKGELFAAADIGRFYFNGTVVKKNYVTALKYYLVAAEKDDPWSQMNAAIIYFMGKGKVRQDFAKAFDLARRAFDNPEYERKCRPAAILSLCLQNGWGIVQNDEGAFMLLNYIEENDGFDDIWLPADGQVCNALGVAYAFGRGTEQNIKKGIAYFDRAIALEDEDAKRNKACFEKNILGLWQMKTFAKDINAAVTKYVDSEHETDDEISDDEACEENANAEAVFGGIEKFEAEKIERAVQNFAGDSGQKNLLVLANLCSANNFDNDETIFAFISLAENLRRYKADFGYLSMLCNIKMKAWQSGALENLSDLELRRFFRTLRELNDYIEEFFSNLMKIYVKESPGTIDGLIFLYTAFKSFSFDFEFFQIARLEILSSDDGLIFPTACPRCGAQVFDFEKGEFNNPRIFGNEEVKGFDFFSVAFDFASRFLPIEEWNKFPTLALLANFFSMQTCPRCGNEVSLLVSMATAYYERNPRPVPSKKLIEWLFNEGDLQKREYNNEQKMRFYYDQAFCYASGLQEGDGK